MVIAGNPKSKESSRTYKTVVQRLESVGFKKVGARFGVRPMIYQVPPMYWRTALRAPSHIPSLLQVMIIASAHGVVAEKGEDRKSKKALHQPKREEKHRSNKRRKNVDITWAPADFEWPIEEPPL